MSEFDGQLLSAWRGGDEAAGAELIERNVGLLAQFFRNKVGHSIDDLVQQTFLKCIESRDKLRIPEKFRSYLLTTARRELYAYYRGRDKEREHLDPDATSVWDLDPTPSTMVVEAEEQRLLAEALRRIPLSFQVALELFYWQELTAAEIGEVLELPEGTVRSRLRRGRELLGEQMANISTSELATQASVEDIELWARSIRDGFAK